MARRLLALPSLAGLVVLAAVVPLAFLAWQSLQLSLPQWQGMWSARIPQLFINTLSLATWVSIGSVVLGVSTAWLVARREFAGRTLATWLMVLPLAIPTYVFAHIYATISPAFYGMAGAAFVLTLASFSYVFLMVRAALALQSPSLDEVARGAGVPGWQRFWFVSLPLVRPALAAGVAIVVLHVLSDFGAVAMLRVQTFTLAIYMQMSGRFDYQGAAGLSMVLVLLSLTFLVVERFFRRQQRYFSRDGRIQRRLPRATGLELAWIWCWLGTVAALAFGVPLAWMLYWTWDALGSGAIGAEFWGYSRNSFVVAVLAALVALVAALPVALYHTRRRSLASAAALQATSVGFVLPGPVIALGVLLAVLAFAGPLYGTLFALVAALAIRFLPLSVQAQEASLQQVTPAVEQAGRSLGAGPLENLVRVVLPMMRGGLAAALVLVFIDALKELPATLLLRPVGFDTLPIRIWIEASEEMLELAAPAALMLVVASVPAIWLMLRNHR
jgi:iron(III) transport system permease protein